MNDLLALIASGLQVATTAMIAIGVLIVGIALVYRGVDIANRVIQRVGVYSSAREADEEAYQDYLERSKDL
ncbi:hypothetical protein [Rheinheimera texasensis]|uniref:hypothetical protein n=1 Tax=Rheinheimera texasensis TaxID=306205 RepID=UPI0032B164ED